MASRLRDALARANPFVVAATAIPRAANVYSGNYGECAPRPTNCDSQSPMVCGCDGKVYSNVCDAAQMGVDIAGSAAVDCAPPEGMFGCGYTFCQKGEEYCVDVFEGGWHCEPLPEECKAPDATCTCLGFDEDGSPGPNAPADCNECNGSGGQLQIGCGAL